MSGIYLKDKIEERIYKIPLSAGLQVEVFYLW